MIQMQKGIKYKQQLNIQQNIKTNDNNDIDNDNNIFWYFCLTGLAYKIS